MRNTYPPTGTPADKLLAMMSDLLDGSLPSIEDILFVQVCSSLYKLVNVNTSAG